MTVGGQGFTRAQWDAVHGYLSSRVENAGAELRRVEAERDEARGDLERVRLAFRGSLVDLHPEANLAEGVGEALARVTVARAELDELRVERDNAIGYRDEALNLRRAMQGERDAARSQRNESGRRVAGLIQRAEEAEEQRDNLRAEVDELTDQVQCLRAVVPDLPLVERMDRDYLEVGGQQWFVPIGNSASLMRERGLRHLAAAARLDWEDGQPKLPEERAAADTATAELPQTPGSVILDRDGDAFQLVKVAHGEDLWRSHASRSDFKASERAFQRELTPVTVLYDAGRQAAAEEHGGPLAQWEVDLLDARNHYLASDVHMLAVNLRDYDAPGVAEDSPDFQAYLADAQAVIDRRRASAQAIVDGAGDELADAFSVDLDSGR